MNKTLPILCWILISMFFFREGYGQCDSAEGYLEIYLTSDANAASDSTRWEVRDEQNQVLLAGNSNYTYCLPADQCYSFYLFDDFGNGLAGAPPGSYELWFDKVLVDAGVDFGSYHAINFGGCAPGTACNFAIPIAGEDNYRASQPDSWYIYTPSATGRYAFRTCQLGNECNTVIWGYDRCVGIITESSQQTAIFYSDDACGLQSEVITHLIGGNSYYIRIGDNYEDCTNTAIEWQLEYLGPVEGCTDPLSCNYEPLATIDNGTCLYDGDANCPQGPDLIVEPNLLYSSVKVENFNNSSNCYIAEGCLKGYGVRQILRFSTHIKNIGNQDYYLGRPPTNPLQQSDEWEWDECHGHWHYEGYAEYRLYDADGVLQPVGFKNGFCVIDLECSGGGQHTYNCSNQGISAGCGDIYHKDLDCQWIDLTDVPDGDYTLVVTVNWDRDTDALGREEISYDNNWAQVCFSLNRNAAGDARIDRRSNCSNYTDCQGVVHGPAQPDCEGNCNGNKKTGDLNQNGVYETGDVQQYLDGLLDESLYPTECNDVSGDSNLSILDPVLLMGCILEQSGQHQQSFHSHLCNFPYLTVVNPGQEASFSLSNHNLDLQFIDIALQNPQSPVLAFNLQIGGLVITEVQSLIQDPNYQVLISYDQSGEIIGFSYQESATPRYTTPTALLRVFYSQLTSDQICLGNEMTVINDQYEVVQGVIGGQPCISSTDTGLLPYCQARSNTSVYEWIDRVVMGSINYQSGNDNGYGDFSNISTPLKAGNTYSITLRPGFEAVTYNEYWQVWIDYNSDGDFEDEGELVFTAIGTEEVTGTFTVPSDLPTVNLSTRMRITMRWNQKAPSCGSYNYGEVEDYTVFIISEREEQSIQFNPIPDKENTDPPFPILASASSGLPVQFEIISGPASISGNVITLNGTIGRVVVRASQPGNEQYNPAPSKELSFDVIPIGPPPTVEILSPSSGTRLSEGPVEVLFQLSGDLVAFNINHVHLTLDDQAYVSVPVEQNSYTFETVGIGEHIITVQLVDAVHLPASNPQSVDRVSFSIVDERQQQSIDFEDVGDKTTTDNPFELVAAASSELPVIFELISGPATLSGNTITLNGTEGTVVVRAIQPGNTEYQRAPDIIQDFIVSEPVQQPQLITFFDIPNKETSDPDFNLFVTANSGLPVSLQIVSGPATLSGNTVSLLGVPGTVVVRASQSGNELFLPAVDVEQSFEVIEAVLLNQVIVFGPIPNKETTDSSFSVTATASSDLPVVLRVVSGPASITGNVITLSGAPGTVVVRATQGGNAIYFPAPDVERSFTVTEPVLLDQTISFGPIPNKETTDSSFSVTATASSDLPVVLRVVSGPASITGNVITLTGTPGTVVVRATQGGNAIYFPAPNVERSFTVTEPVLLDQTISFGPIPNKETTDSSFSVTATASSDLPVVLRVVSGPASITGNVITLTGAPGTVVVRATQGGNAIYFPAPDVERSFTVTEPVLLDQTISFGPIPNKETTDSSFSVTATASSDLPVVLRVVSGPASITGNVITLTGTPGTVVVRATQGGNAIYFPAPDVERSFTVTEPVLLDQTISFGPIPNKETTDSSFSVTATASSDLPVVLRVVSGPASITGNVITLTGTPGTVVVRATQGGNAIYFPAPDVERSFTVTEPVLLDQTISFGPIPNKETTDSSFSVTATASSDLPVVLRVVSGPASITGNVITLTGTPGTVVVRATQSGNAIYHPAIPVERSFIIVQSEEGGCQPANMALGKVARQSSTVFGAHGGRAVDGNTEGDFSSGSVLATKYESHPWWELDLGQMVNMKSIRIWNRTDHRSDRLSNYYVFVSDQPFGGLTLEELKRDTSVTSFYESATAGTPSILNTNIRARYLRIQLNYAEYLTIAEVEVMGCPVTEDEVAPQVLLQAVSDEVMSAVPVNIDFSEQITGLSLGDFQTNNVILSDLSLSNGQYSLLATPIAEGPVQISLPASAVQDLQGNENDASNLLEFNYYPPQESLCSETINFALNQVATQSGTQYGGSADKAVDGNSNGQFFSGSVTATPQESNAWWELDLGQTIQIEFLQLWNRTDNRRDRFSNFYVLVSEEPFNSSSLEASLKQAGVYKFYQKGEVGTPTKIPVGRTGRYLRIQLNYTEFLTIAEVEVMGCTQPNADTLPPVAILQTAAIEVEGPFEVDLEFSESVAGLSLADFVIDNGTLSNLTGSGTNYGLMVSPLTAGMVQLSLPANVVTDEAGNANTVSNLLEVHYLPPVINEAYCAPGINFPWHDWIAGVKLSTLDHSSGKSQYSDFTDHAAELMAGSNYTLELTTAYSYTGYEDHFRVWIDFNRDKDFEDGGELVFSGVNPAPADGTPSRVLSGELFLPASVARGTTRMRVAMKRGGSPDACESFEFGEVEDYTVIITAATTGVSERAQLYFSAERIRRSAELNWWSNTSFKTKHFTVERSADGQQFQQIAELIPARGGKNRLVSFQYRDWAPLEGTNYYRLKQLLRDGSHRYTDVRKVEFDKDLAKVTLYPNPSRGEVWLDLSRYRNKAAQLRIYNTLGQEMYQQDISLIGTEPLRLDLRNWQNGVYHISVKVEGHRQLTERVVLNRWY